MQIKKLKGKLKTKQFTLIELIIVIVVIGLLAGMALPKFIGTTKDAKVSAMDQDLDVLEKAVDLYVSDNDGNYPFTGGKVSVTAQTLKDTLDTIGDNGSQVYTLDMDKLKPYLQNLKYSGEEYEYSTISNTAINPIGKIDSSGITHHIIDGGISNGNSTPVVQSDFVKKQIHNLILLSTGQVIDTDKNTIVQTNIKDFYYSSNAYTNNPIFITNANEVMYQFPGLTVKVSGLSGTIDKVSSDGDDMIISNTNGDIFYSFDNDFTKLSGFTGTIDKIFNFNNDINNNQVIITNTSGEVFYSSCGSTFTKLSGITGTIDKMYSDGCNTTVVTTNGDIFYSQGGNNFTQLSGLSGTIDKVYSNGFNKTIINTNGDIFYTSGSHNFAKVSGFTGTIDKIFSGGNYTTIIDTSGNVFYSQWASPFTKVSTLSGVTGTIDKVYVDGNNMTIINTNGDVFYGHNTSKGDSDAWHFTQLSGFSGTIDKIYSSWGYTTITNTNGDVYSSDKGSNFIKIKTN